MTRPVRANAARSGDGASLQIWARLIRSKCANAARSGDGASL